MLVATWQRTDVSAAELRELLAYSRERARRGLEIAGGLTRPSYERMLFRIDERLAQLDADEARVSAQVALAYCAPGWAASRRSAGPFPFSGRPTRRKRAETSA